MLLQNRETGSLGDEVPNEVPNEDSGGLVIALEPAFVRSWLAKSLVRAEGFEPPTF